MMAHSLSVVDQRMEFGLNHTILLIQTNRQADTRTYSDFESVKECMEGVCQIYEEHLKRQYPSKPTITYDMSQLFNFLDQLADLSCLVFQKATNSYVPYNKEWIKEKTLKVMRDAAANAD